MCCGPSYPFRYLLSSLFAILGFLHSVICVGYGSYVPGFLTKSQDQINRVGTYISINNEELIIKCIKRYLIQTCEYIYKLEDITALKLYSDCILCQMNKSIIILLPKRLFTSYKGMELYYNKLKARRFGETRQNKKLNKNR